MCNVYVDEIFEKYTGQSASSISENYATRCRSIRSQETAYLNGERERETEEREREIER